MKRTVGVPALVRRAHLSAGTLNDSGTPEQLARY